MSETIRKYKRERNFTTVTNDFLQDKNLSWKAKGLITYIMSLPPDWNINISDLKNRSKDGRDATAAALKEIIDNDYCLKTVARSETGVFSGVNYEVSDMKIPKPENPLSDDKPKTENPEPEKPPIINTDSNKKTDSNASKTSFTGSLFSDTEIEKKEKNTLFSNSDVGNLETFLSKFVGPDFEKIDLTYYFNSVNDWSDSRNKKRTSRGWIATARQFMRSDKEKGRLKFKIEASGQSMDISGAIDFLNDNF